MKFRWGHAALACVLMATLSPQLSSAERMRATEMGARVLLPKAPMHPAMYDVILGIGSPLTYKAQVEPAREYKVVLGFAETWWEEVGKRPMVVSVEGASAQPIDLAKNPGKSAPLGLVFTGKDVDGNGWLDIAVSPVPNAPDQNTIMSAMWIYDKRTWDEDALTLDKVFSGQYDTRTLYFVDGGAYGSDRIDLSFEDAMTRVRTRIQGLKKLAGTEPEVSAVAASALPTMESKFAVLESTLAKHQVLELSAQLRAFEAEFNQIHGAAERALIARYKPAFTKAAETRMCSPWGAFVKIRQERDLRLNFEAYPRPASNDYLYHSPYARRSPMDWIEISTSSPGETLSRDMALDYNVQLKAIDYDPLVTTYRYSTGSVKVQVLNTSAVVMQPRDLTLTVSFPKTKMKSEDGIWYSQVETRGGSIYYGLIFRDPKSGMTGDGPVECGGLALLWADSIGELKSVARRVRNWDRIQAESAVWADRAAKDVTLLGASPYPWMFDLNQKALYSMQFVGGPMLAALDGGYLFTWVRDITNASVFAAQAGDPQFLRKWAPYLMRNASNIEKDGKRYKSFFTFPGDGVEYGKKEQDGQFYGILTAYSYWRLTGDASKLKEWYPILKSTMDYQRSNYFDPRIGLYWETSVNEASLKSAPEWAQGERFPSLMVGNDWPLYNFGIYINNLMYANHLMLAEISKQIGDNADYLTNMRMASELASSIDAKLWDDAKGYYRLGLGQMDTGKLEPLDWNYHDSFFDYVWAYTLFPMTPDPEKSLKSLDAILRREGTFPGSNQRMYFAPAFAHASYVYAAAGQFDKSRITLDRLTKRSLDVDTSVEMNALYVMKGTILEHMWMPGIHRPEAFGIGPWLHAALSQTSYMDYNGITVVPGPCLNGARDIKFKDAVLSIDTRKAGDVSGIVFDGKPVPHTLRIPMDILTPGSHSISLLSGEETDGPVLGHTDFELNGVSSSGNRVRFRLRGFGTGVLRFTGGLAKDDLSITGADGRPLPFSLWSAEGGTRVQLNANGNFTVIAKR